MTESSTIEAPTLSQDTLDRLADLRRQRRAITHEIKEILGSVIEDIAARPMVECLRCGFVWTPHSPAIRPRACARCVTTAWDKPPTATSRKPSDPPSPSWRVRSTTARRRPRMQPEPKRILYRRTRAEMDMDRAQADGKSSNGRTSVLEADNLGSSPSLPATVPPRISALLPPPPTPSPSHAPSQTLSAWLRDVVIEDGKSEPQPERVSSHAASPKTVEVISHDGYESDASAGVSTPDPTPVEEEIVIDVPPEQIGLPQTDAEREELEKARFEVWPTTRGDDD